MGKHKGDRTAESSQIRQKRPHAFKGIGGSIVIAVLLIAITLTNSLMIFRMTATQTKNAGIYQLSVISGQMESAMNDAKNNVMRLAIQAQLCLNDREKLTRMIYERKKYYRNSEPGFLNVYIAGEDWDIVPDFNDREGFIASKRSWYTGAMRNGGSPYITPPYIDVVTGDVCFTVSVSLADGDAVLGIDYNMDRIQKYVRQLYGNGAKNAVVVTGRGIIAGSASEELIGKQLADVLPEYAAIYSLAKVRNSVVSNRVRVGLGYENLFATRSGTGWYLIVSESDWDLYHSSYLQLLITSLLTLSLFAVILILYYSTIRSRKRVEAALASRDAFLTNLSEELKEPLRIIVDHSETNRDTPLLYPEEELVTIHEAGRKLSDKIDQILSYTSILKANEAIRAGSGRQKKTSVSRSRRVLPIITAFLLIVMMISLYLNNVATWRWSISQMQNKGNVYETEVSGWIHSQKSILDMFCSVISTNPDLIKDYDRCIEYLDRITQQYPEISVSYLANPELSPSVYMNNGWLPAAGWHVEERTWYLDTMASESGWSISSPYYDAQTGFYCLTLSEQVFDAVTGEFLGVFGIDFYMDKLVDILGGSYAEDGYAFLVDAGGNIINHPYGRYQMSETRTVNVSSLPYGEIMPDTQDTVIFRDYDGTLRIMIAIRSTSSNFSIYVVTDIRQVFLRIILFNLICVLTFLSAIVMVFRMLRRMIREQDTHAREMKEAMDAALSAEKVKGDFLAQMSHEIRTPINAVLGMNEMILRKSREADTLEYASGIRSSGHTLLSLINSILDFSKLESGMMKILPVRYETAALINGLVHSISDRAAAKGLTFRVDADETLPAALFGDDMRISQVIMNLLTNAVKYTEKGSVTLSIRDGGRTGDEIDLIVSVKDTGIGIRPEDRKRLFSTFERLDEQRNRTIEGTGLGMAIVTRLLNMMGSSLEVESVYGQGSVFSFRLRQRIESDQPMGDLKDAVSDPVSSGQATALSAPRARILVVDDNDINRKVFFNLLQLCDIHADLAASGQEALDLARENSYHIILLDHMMPQMDGIETLKRLHSDGLLRPQTTVIALTANAITGAREEYLRVGFDDYLSKPVELKQLEQMLARYLPADIAEQRTEDRSEPVPPQEPAPSQDMGPDDAARIPDAVPEEVPAAAARTPEESIRLLNEAGIDTSEGILYTGDSIPLYLDTLREYVTGAVSKSEEMIRLYRAESWDDYRILVHSLKSVSRMIGATDLSDRFRQMEEAGKAVDVDYIRSHHQELYNDFQEITGKIRFALGD